MISKTEVQAFLKKFWGESDPISDKVCRELMAQVVPLIKRDGEKLCTFDEPSSLSGVSFLWDPQNVKPYKGKLKPLRKVMSLHSFGYHGLFKPSLAETYAPLVGEDLTGVVALHLDGPQNVDDLNAEWDAVNAGYHVGWVTLYGKAE